MHEDNTNERWVNKQKIYVNTFIVEMRALLYKATGTLRPALDNGLVMSEGATKVSVEDKAAVYVGKPGFPCRSNTGKIYAFIVADSDIGKASAGDQGVHWASMGPTMTMFMMMPLISSCDSWRTGKVTCSLKDCATQRSSPKGHSLEFIKQCRKQEKRDDYFMLANPLTSKLENTSMPLILVQRSDGGADRNPKKSGLIVLSIHTFLQLNLCTLVAIVMAADISYINKVDGVMPVANLALQNQACSEQKR
jgi:hypothetical protein